MPGGSEEPAESTETNNTNHLIHPAMRPELELIEKIERYLNNELSDADKVAFEKQIVNDPALQEEINLQLDVMQGIERADLIQKIQTAKKNYTWRMNFRNWGLGGFVVIIVLIAALLYYNSKTDRHSYEGTSLPEYNEQGEKQWADADRNIPAQQFIIDAAKDTVIETRGGIVMAIAANSFLDENGKPVNGNLQLVVKEALDEATIINGGLSTRSGNDLLETGGMFFIDARKDGNILSVDPSKGIYTEIPTDSIKPGMQLFKGNRKPDGTIDWINPKPIERDLVPVDIETLNFYPPGYLDSLQRWGDDITNKKFTDSLYYSFAWLFSLKMDTVYISERFPDRFRLRVHQSDSLPSNGMQVDPIFQRFYSEYFSHGCCEINPAKIKTIWSKDFENTILSTREFEERITWIHKACDYKILDMYINNLDKNLSDIDSMVALQLPNDGYYRPIKNQFLSFASRHNRKVKNGSKQFQLLRDYYQNKTKAFTEAIIKTQDDFWKKQRQLDEQANRKKFEHEIDSTNRVNQNIEEEFTINLKEAYRQLGYDTLIKPQRNISTYNVQVTTTGWNNVDRYVVESTVNRSTLDYTDTQTGKKAVINYEAVSIEVNQWKEYDQLYVYLIPDKLSSFMRVNGANGKYSEKLNELIKYKLICIAYKGEQSYYYSMDNVEAKEYTDIVFTAIQKEELGMKLNGISNLSQASAVLKENEYFQLYDIDQKRQANRKTLQILRGKVLLVIFPCLIHSEGAYLIADPDKWFQSERSYAK